MKHTKWEYWYEEATAYERGRGYGELPSAECLSQLGAEGWELAGIAPEWGNSPVTFVFKRPLQEQSEEPKKALVYEKTLGYRVYVFEKGQKDPVLFHFDASISGPDFARERAYQLVERLKPVAGKEPSYDKVVVRRVKGTY